MNDKDLNTIVLALTIAQQRYIDNAAVLLENGFPRLAEVFRHQATEAVELIAKLEDELALDEQSRVN